MKNNKKMAIYIAFALLFIYVFYKFFLAEYLDIATIKANIQTLASFVSAHYVISVILYMLVYFILIASAVPATGPMSMAGGFLFGVIPTVIYSTIAATAGAVISFLSIKLFASATIEEKYGHKLEKLRVGLKEYGSFYLLLIHFTFLMPFFIINSLAVLAGVSIWQFIWTTIVGFIPCTYVYAFSGQKLLTIRGVRDILSWQFMIAIILLILVGTLPLIIKRFSKSDNNGL